MSPLLELSRVSVAIGKVALLDRISLSVEPGRILGLVGESGSGKSLTAMAAIGLLPLIGGRVTEGEVRFAGRDIAAMSEAERRALRGRRIGFVTQNPMTALDPVQRIGGQVDIVSRMHLRLTKTAARARTLDLLTQLRIPDAAAVVDAYPHQLSGGMKQRIVIAMALAGEPELIIADEPTTALDVTVQAQIIQILGALVRDRGLALLLITHDMGVIAQICDRVAVLYCGRLAEEGPVGPIFAAPAHPYTAALIDCIPQEGTARGSLRGIPGAVPSALAFSTGCRFHPRCRRATGLCQDSAPPLLPRDAGSVACHHAGAAP
ncbi:ABC transporter ATP-binding protein [Pseudaminobacter sp. 19-2017]|uniref:ABC transporter ATP-binding protein n=1 Tax=Pseudaminobacter soli (ex Zhang et al. 2022) TaxID=2831468 RepID=A0A942E8L1_9HYPH|nr:ABC transporter ATP-binding protein [Pseudaminobacter soli]MBS3652425.1 ABC transporter ATP-binding protein [Pseudaminobacter soli]